MGRPSLNDQFVEINSKWDDSAPQRALIRFIKRTVLPLESLTVHSALCLGLGSMENRSLTLLRGPAKDPHAVDSQEVPISWEDEAPSDEDDAEAVKPISCGVHLNSSLYQLAFFETVLLTLREKSLINTVQFQDPAFTHADREFLQQRGYTVLPWSSGTGPKSKPCDPVVLESVRESTFFFAPYLDRPVVAQVICAGMLSLFLGHDLLLEIVYPATVSSVDGLSSNVKRSFRSEIKMWSNSSATYSLTAFEDSNS